MKDMQGKEIKMDDEVVYVVIRYGSSRLHIGKIITIADTYVRVKEYKENTISVLKKEENIFVK